jgi:hypothetical protein
MEVGNRRWTCVVVSLRGLHRRTGLRKCWCRQDAAREDSREQHPGTADRSTIQHYYCVSPVAQEGKKPTVIAFDEEGHRLFVGPGDPGKLIVLDSHSGKIVTSYPAAAMVDDLVYNGTSKRIYFAGTEFLDVFHQKDADHYDRIGHIPTSFRAKTGVLVPELNRYYLAVPHHGKQAAELRVYEVLP